MKKCYSCSIVYTKDISFCPLCGSELIEVDERHQDSSYTYAVYNETGAIEITGCKLKDKMVVVPSSLDGHPVVSIGAYSFAQNRNIKHLTIPEGVKKIDHSAFYKSSLKTIVLPSSLREISIFPKTNDLFFENHHSWDKKTGLTQYGAFEESDLESVEFKNGLEAIGARTFYGCKHLSSIVLPNTIIRLGECAFKKSGVQRINLPLGITEIGRYCFSDAPLEKIVWPKTCIVINEGCFDGCSSLKTVRIPPGVIKIGQFSFGDCSSLEKICIPSTIEDISYNSFQIQRGGTYRKWGGPYGWITGYGTTSSTKITFYCEMGSYASSFATSHGFKHDLIENWEE